MSRVPWRPIWYFMFIMFWIALCGGLETEEVLSFYKKLHQKWALGLHIMHTSPKQAFSPNPKLKHQ